MQNLRWTDNAANKRSFAVYSYVLPLGNTADNPKKVQQTAAYLLDQIVLFFP